MAPRQRHTDNMSQTVYVPQEFEQFDFLKTDDLVELTNKVDQAFTEMDGFEQGTKEYEQARLRSVAIKKEIAEIAVNRVLSKQFNTSDEKLKVSIETAVMRYFCNLDERNA